MKEYKTLSVDYSQTSPGKVDEQLNKLANEGWTIVFCLDIGQNNFNYAKLFILERFKSQ